MCFVPTGPSRGRPAPPSLRWPSLERRGVRAGRGAEEEQQPEPSGAGGGHAAAGGARSRGAASPSDRSEGERGLGTTRAPSSQELAGPRPPCPRAPEREGGERTCGPARLLGLLLGESGFLDKPGESDQSPPEGDGPGKGGPLRTEPHSFPSREAPAAKDAAHLVPPFARPLGWRDGQCPPACPAHWWLSPPAGSV